jgi:phosphoribosyl-dephospho-CoA transferase
MENLNKKTKAELIDLLKIHQKPVVHNSLHMNGNITVSNKMNKVNEQQLTNLTEALLNVSEIIRDRNKGGNYAIFMSQDGFKTKNK